MNRIRRLAKEGSWIIVGQGASVLGSLVLVRFLTERLDPAQYGQLALGLTVAGLVTQVLMGGAVAGIGRHYSIAVEKRDLGSYLVASRNLMVFATLAMVPATFLLMLALLLRGAHQWAVLAAVALVFSALSGYNSALSGIQNAARQRAIVAFHGGLDSWLKIPFVMGAFYWLGKSSITVLIGYTFAIMAVTVSQYCFLRRSILGGNMSCVDSAPWMRELWAYSWPIAAAGLFNWGYYASQRWALELYATTSEVGQFYAMTQIAYVPISLAGAMFITFLTPILFSRAGDASSRDRLKDSHRIILRVAVFGLALTALAAIVSAFAHPIVFRLLVAAEYRSISGYMPYVVAAAGILQVSQSLAVLVTIENETSRFLPLAVFGNAVTALLNLYSTSRWGVSGLVASMVVGAILHLAWMTLIVSKNVMRLRGSVPHGVGC